MIRTTLGLRHHVVDGEVPKREVVPAPGAHALLHAEQRVLVGAVVRQRYDVGPLRNVLSPHGLEQQGALSVQACLDELAREQRQIDADPLARQAVAQPQNGSRITSPSLELALMMRSSRTRSF